MKREEQKILIDMIRQLAKDGDLILDTFLRIAEVGIRSEMYGQKVSQEYIDDSLTDRFLFSILLQSIPLQATRIQELQSELMTLKQMKQV